MRRVLWRPSYPGRSPSRYLSALGARNREAIAAPAQCFYGAQGFVGVELAPQAPDEHLDDIAVALVVLVVETLGEFGLGDHVTGAQHHVLEDAVLESGELDGRTTERDCLRARVEFDGPALEDR